MKIPGHPFHSEQKPVSFLPLKILIGRQACKHPAFWFYWQYHNGYDAVSWPTPQSRSDIDSLWLVNIMKKKCPTQKFEKWQLSVRLGLNISMGGGRKWHWVQLELINGMNNWFLELKWCCLVCQFATAAITKYSSLGVLTEIYFLIVLEAKSLRSRCGQGWFLLRLFLPCRWLSSPCVFAWSSWSSQGLNIVSLCLHMICMCLYSNLLFLWGYRSYWIRAHTNDCTLT